MYARLCAEDLLTYSQCANSVIIKKGLIAQGYKPYDTHTAVSKAVRRYATAVKNDIITLLETKIKNGERFSVTLDEFTARNNCRFTDFNVHFPWLEPKCIGMKRIHGSLDSEAAAEAVEEQLCQYGLDINVHVVANTTDGCSMMVSMGKMLPTIHQLCMAHAIHLSVVAVVYKVIQRFNYIVDRAHIRVWTLPTHKCMIRYRKRV